MVVSSGPLDGRIRVVKEEKNSRCWWLWRVGLACYEEVKSNLERKCAFLRGLCLKGRQKGLIVGYFNTWESFYGCLKLEKVEFGCTHFAWLEAATAVLLKNGAKSEFALILGQKWVKNKSYFLRECSKNVFLGGRILVGWQNGEWILKL